jgi:hypothetical protein
MDGKIFGMFSNAVLTYAWRGKGNYEKFEESWVLGPSKYQQLKL